MKVLINAYTCSPYRGSEHAVGWNYIKGLSISHELYVITESKSYKDICKYKNDHPDELKNCQFFSIEKKRHKLLRKIWPPSYYWFYKEWQKKALHLAKKLDEKVDFDLIHQLTMVGFREPGFLYELKKNIVWGPIGGMHVSPWKMLPYIGLYGCIYYGMRNLLNIVDMHLKRRPAKMARYCRTLIAATQDAHDAAKTLWNRESIIIPEAGMLDGSLCSNVQIHPRGNKLKIAWSGNHTPAKALNFLIDALTLCKNKDDVELHILGDGVYSQRWKKLAEKYNVEKNVVWHGRKPRNEALDIMKGCDLFCITSLADLTSTVLLEALSCALPVISFDLFGFSNVITSSCGIKIKVSSKEETEKKLALAIDYIFENESVRLQLSNGALKRAQDFLWTKKIQMVNEIYHKIGNDASL